ncbi:MAG: hypothetical protein GXY44_05805 [Phycisphaerales bacterium]|nr:hypothetical protein [Phycisphaerales bacterium]
MSVSVNAPRRRGHQHKPVIGFDGQPVPNLSSVAFKYKTDSDGQYVLDHRGHRIIEKYRYFVTGSKPIVWLGFDLKDAIRRLHLWETQQKDCNIIVTKSYRYPEALTDEKIAAAGWPSGVPDEEELKQLEQNLSGDELRTSALANESWISEDRRTLTDYEVLSLDEVFVAMQRVLDDPGLRKLAAEATGYPLDRLETLPEPRESPTLVSLLTLFEEKADVTHDWRGKVKQFWGEFSKSVGVRTVREVTQRHIAAYYDQTIAMGKSPTYSSHRFGAIKRVFNFARIRGVSSSEIRTILDYCAILQAPQARAFHEIA